MKHKYHHTTGDLGAPGTMAQAHSLFYDLIEGWFIKFGDKIADGHFLQVNPVKVYWSKERTKYTRTADLRLNADQTSAPYAGDKVLVRTAVEYIAEWKNPHDG